MNKPQLIGVLCAAVFTLISTSSQATLIAKMGGQVVYDDDYGPSGLTWLADANLATTMDFGVIGIDLNGEMEWDTAIAWIAGMNAFNSGNGYLGYNDWRLPTALNQDGTGPCFGYSCTDSEMAHLFYNELGGTAHSSILSSADPDLALFSNVQADRYWSSTEYVPDPTDAWDFYFDDGGQDRDDKSGGSFAWAVRAGDVTAVAEPPMVWLFATGLLGLLGVSGRQRRIR